MNKNNFYVQCRLRKDTSENSYRLDEVWIPEKFAVMNKFIKVKVDGKMEDGWEVIFVGIRKEAKLVEDKERDYLKQRKASDV